MQDLNMIAGVIESYLAMALVFLIALLELRDDIAGRFLIKIYVKWYQINDIK